MKTVKSNVRGSLCQRVEGDFQGTRDREKGFKTVQVCLSSPILRAMQKTATNA